MKKIIKSAKMDENFYTIPKHVPSRDVAVENCVTGRMIDMLKDICDKLELDFKDIGWDIMTNKQFGALKAELVDLISDELYKRGIK